MRVPVAGAAEARRQRVALQLSEPSVPGAHGALGPCMVEDLASGAMSKSRVVVPSLAPVPSKLAVSTDGALVQCTGGGGGADGEAESVNCFSLATGESNPGSRGSWLEANPGGDARAVGDADGACVFVY